jgi:ATP-dependent DNA ligase
VVVARAWCPARETEVLMKIDTGVFASDAFVFQKRYQGCGTDITGENDEALLAKYEASGEYTAEPKCDGIFCTAFILPAHRFISRNCKEKAYGLSSHQSPTLKHGTALVGELGMGTEHAVQRRQQYGHDFMDVHDIVALEYEDVSQMGDDDRRKLLEQWHASLDPATQARFRLLPRFTCDFVQEYRAQHEGLVLKKKGNKPYVGNKRKVRYWVKAKKAFEADMVVMDFRLSSADTKSHEPMVESVLCGQFVHGTLEGLVWVGSMEQHWQRELAQNFGAYKGQVVRIRHYGQFKSGSLRHPSFHQDGFRDDKDPQDCVFK